jgi:hypothetical protein
VNVDFAPGTPDNACALAGVPGNRERGGSIRVLKKNENVVFRKIAGESILVPVASSVADLTAIFSLNETGAFIWEKIDGRTPLADILELLKAEYEDQGSLAADADAFVAELLEAGLIRA